MAPAHIHLEPLFQALVLDLLVPSTGTLNDPPSKKSDQVGLRAWYDGLKAFKPRDTAFLDEKLAYAVTATIPYASLSTSDESASDTPPPEVSALARQLQLTATASFLPPVPSPSPTAWPGSSSGGATPVDKRQSAIGGRGGAGFSGTPTNLTPSPSSNTPTRDHNAPPLTPVPVPAYDPTTAAQQYAGMEGVPVWEGVVETPDGSRPVLVKGEDGWHAVWRGEMPVIYVRTSIPNPVLALTTSATLRETGTTRRRNTNAAGDAASVYSATTLQTDHGQETEEDDDIEDLATMEEIDLLGGLTDEILPATRLGPSLRDDLSVPAPPPVSSVFSPATPHAVTTTPRTPLMTTSTTLRKSFRRVLNLSPGLRVRMRTLFLPQLLPPTDEGDAESEDAGERRIVLCIEIENGAEAGHHSFVVDGVGVDVGGKGAKVGTSLLCQPGQELKPAAPVFPLRLNHHEQYNLLYAVDIVAPSNGVRGDEHRPVSIVLTGRPFDGESAMGDNKDYNFLTSSFQSRWNCSLDLAPFYASLPPAPPAPHAHAPQTRQMAHRLSKPTPPTPNAIAGDKRYSLSMLLADKPAAQGTHHPGDRRLVTPFLPSTASRVVSTRAPNSAVATGDGRGLLVSVKVLPLDSPDAPSGIAAQHTFFIEVFINNRTDSVKRFRLSVPPRDAYEGRLRDAWLRRRRRAPDEPAWGADDAVLAALLTQYEANNPPLVALETDVRCGPLLPGASLAARLRFLALRDGVHRIERLRITGVGEDFDFVLSPVLEVVVGAVG